MATVLGFTVENWGSPQIGTYLIPGTAVKLTMRKEIAPLLVAYARDFNATVEPLRVGWCWGFDPKPIEGTHVWSNHAWGGALDLNAPAHPMGKANTFTPAKRAAIDKLLTKYSFQGKRLLRSGKDYKGRKDDMHIEINVERDFALAAVKAMSSAVTFAPGSRKLSKGMKGADVKFMQGKVGAQPDGDFGPETEGKVVKFQVAKKIGADGIVGRDTWTAMGVKYTGK